MEVATRCTTRWPFMNYILREQFILVGAPNNVQLEMCVLYNVSICMAVPLHYYKLSIKLK